MSWLPIVLLLCGAVCGRNDQVAALIFWVVAYQVFGNIISPHWPSLIPPGARKRGLSRRTRVATLVGFAALVAAGGVLRKVQDAHRAMYGFLLLFALAAVARMISGYYPAGCPIAQPSRR